MMVLATRQTTSKKLDSRGHSVEADASPFSEKFPVKIGIGVSLLKCALFNESFDKTGCSAEEF
jgi:hypothetical protein